MRPAVLPPTLHNRSTDQQTCSKRQFYFNQSYCHPSAFLYSCHNPITRPPDISSLFPLLLFAIKRLKLANFRVRDLSNLWFGPISVFHADLRVLCVEFSCASLALSLCVQRNDLDRPVLRLQVEVLTTSCRGPAVLVKSVRGTREKVLVFTIIPSSTAKATPFSTQNPPPTTQCHLDWTTPKHLWGKGLLG